VPDFVSHAPQQRTDEADEAEPLIIGPVLRRVQGDSATIWVQTASAGTVRITAGTVTAETRTFCAHDLHFALVVLDGLPLGEATPYEVEVNGERAWPPPDYGYPAPVIRTRGDDDAPVHIVFGSCRESSPMHVEGLEPDALDAYAARLARSGAAHPDLLMLLGDQVYADVTSKSTRAWLKRHRHEHYHADAPPTQVVTFPEYARLYRESWSDPDVRWLLSTVSTVMIFDDHEIIDDWNTSLSWRREVRELDWWSDRIAAGLGSYWVFQHAGNLDPTQLTADPAYQRIMECNGADAKAALREFALAADAASDAAAGDVATVAQTDGAVSAAGALAEAMSAVGRAETAPSDAASAVAVADHAASGAYRWSYQFDLGRTKVVMLDNRCGRVLTPGRRAMVSAIEWAWFASVVTGEEVDYEHLVIGSSLPWLMPYAIHDLEAASERWAESDSRVVASFGERTRRALDFEHWAAFGASFDDLAATLAAIGSGDSPPASISVLSGDVHHSYVARAAYGPDVRTPVYQLTCSPVHNRVPGAIKPLMRSAWHRRGKRIGRVLARRAGAVRPLVSWRKLAGPFFGNAISTLCLDGRSAYVTIERTDKQGTLVPMARTSLTASAPSESAGLWRRIGRTPRPRPEPVEHHL
jgi:PhoD-like phosphatase